MIEFRCRRRCAEEAAVTLYQCRADAGAEAPHAADRDAVGPGPVGRREADEAAARTALARAGGTTRAVRGQADLHRAGRAVRLQRDGRRVGGHVRARGARAGGEAEVVAVRLSEPARSVGSTVVTRAVRQRRSNSGGRVAEEVPATSTTSLAGIGFLVGFSNSNCSIVSPTPLACVALLTARQSLPSPVIRYRFRSVNPPWPAVGKIARGSLHCRVGRIAPPGRMIT